MKFFYIFLILILNIYIANAEISIFKETYSPKETFQAELNFKNLVEEIAPSNIKILNSEIQQTNIGFLLAKITDEKYFVYFDVPEVGEGEYFLVVSIKYIDNEILRTDTFDKKFLVKKEENNLLSAKPYLIFNQREKNFFKVDLKDSGNNILNVKISEDSNSTNIFNNNLTIAKNSEDSFYFNIIESLVKDKDRLNIKIDYNNNLFIIPVFLLLNEQRDKLSFYKNEEIKNYINSFDLEFPFGNYAESSIFLENNLDKNLSNLALSISENLKQIIKIGFNNIEFLETKKSLGLTFFINVNRDIEVGEYNGYLLISNKETKTNLPISIKITESQIYQEEIPNIETQETIETETSETKQDIKPAGQKKKLSKKTIVYISIFAVILVFLLIFLTLYLRVGKKRKKY